MNDYLHIPLKQVSGNPLNKNQPKIVLVRVLSVTLAIIGAAI